jgi:hypothetical protein
MGNRFSHRGLHTSFVRGSHRSLWSGWFPLLILSSLSGLAGCNAMSGCKDHWDYGGAWNEFMMSYRDEAWANKSWHARKHQFCREKHLHEFCDGFRAGYASVCDGSDGCTPAFAPRKYWGWKYQSAEGQEKVAAWYAGYPHGARAAEEDGIGNWSQIQTSTNVQQRFAEQGRLGPGQSVGMYPMPQAEPAAAAYAKDLKTPAGIPGGDPSQPTTESAPLNSAVKPNSPLLQR